MNIFYLNRESLTIHHYYNLIKTAIHINNQYYFLIQDKKIIIQYNPTEKIYKRYYVNHSYSAFCYDETCKCFWAFDNNSNILYKLNFKFEEVQLSTLFNHRDKKMNIFSISYNKFNDTLIICSKRKIYVIDKISFICILQSNYNNPNMLNLAYINDSFISLEKTTKQQFLKVYDTSFDLITSIPIPPTINAQGFMINKHYSDTKSLIVSILNIQDNVIFLEHIILLNRTYCLLESKGINHKIHTNCCLDYMNICKVDGGVF